ncbi:hypothetical protein V8G54_029150 [Vigna mungo]|uniref:Uncharacterized protein n=1 Tax=Vigna mungo TaxID=3915 RepID=A0AAQ3MST5_VIGMU
MDLHAKSLFVPFCTHRNVVPNCPCPSFLPKLKNSFMFSVFRPSTESTCSPILDNRFTCVGFLALSPEVDSVWLDAGFSWSRGWGILTGSGGVFCTRLGGSAGFEGAGSEAFWAFGSGVEVLLSAEGAGRRDSGGRVFHTAAETDWRKPLPTFGPTQLLPIGVESSFTNARDSTLAPTTPSPMLQSRGKP